VRARRLHVVAVAGATAVLAVVAGAFAATGSLTYLGCIADDGAGGCERPGRPSLGNNTAMAISPGGGSVYVAAFEGTLTWLERAAGGGLIYRNCFADEGAHKCRSAFHDSMESATGVAVSPDGESVYVTSAQGASAITRFKRRPSGRLGWRNCIANGGKRGGTPGCRKAPRNSLASNQAIALSPEGRTAYVVSSESDSITWFKRKGSGALTYRNCIANRGRHGCGRAKENSLGGAHDVAVSPDGQSVYVVSMDADTITRFDRRSGGGLEYRNCITSGRAHGCRKSQNRSLGGAAAVAVSADGKSVYVAALGGDAITHFKRGRDGSLKAADCFANAGAHGCREPRQRSLTAANGVVVGPDGESVYVSGMTGPTVNGGPGALSLFDRGSDGSLRSRGCFADRGRFDCRRPDINSLGSPESIAISPDGTSLYVGSFGREVSIFGREAAVP
jgi:DNA-binding beta-propeller fold protein YncE